MLNTLPVESIRTELYEQWTKNPKESGATRWRALRDATNSALNDASSKGNKKRSNINYAELDAWRYELVLTHCYARLDINVSKTQNHLLKSPFCVHPKTGKVCVPIDPHTVDDFDPFSTSCVPTLNSLQREVRALFQFVWWWCVNDCCVCCVSSWITGLALLRRATMISRRPR